MWKNVGRRGKQKHHDAADILCVKVSTCFSIELWLPRALEVSAWWLFLGDPEVWVVAERGWQVAGPIYHARSPYIICFGKKVELLTDAL